MRVHQSQISETGSEENVPADAKNSRRRREQKPRGTGFDAYIAEGTKEFYTGAQGGPKCGLWAVPMNLEGDNDADGAALPPGDADVQGDEMPFDLPTGGFVPGFAQPQAPAAEPIDERREKFSRSLAELRDRGVKIEFARALCLTTSGLSSDDRDIVRVLETIVLKKSKFDFVDEDGIHVKPDDLFDSAGADIIDQPEINPLTFLESGSGQVLLADPDLVDPTARGNKKAEAVPYSLDFSKVDGVYHLTALNWVTGKPLLSLELPEEQMSPPVFVVMVLKMIEALNADYSRKALDAAVQSLPSSARETLRAEDGYLFNDADASAWSVDEENTSRKSWRGLADNFDAEITAQPFDTNIDSVIRHVSLNPDQGGRAGSPLNVNGTVESFSFSPKSVKQALAMGADETMTPYIEVESIQDKYGNLIIPIFSEIGKKHKKMIFAGFQIIPSRALAHNGKDGYASVGVDLTEFGLGDHPMLFKQRVESPVLTSEESATPYAMYSNVTDKDEETQRKAFDRAAAEIAKVESYFGFTPGDLVKAVYMLPSHVANANTIESNSDTVFIWDELYPELLAENGEFAASHETFHLMDFRFDVSEDETVKQVFDAMSKSYDQDLFPLIDESNYLTFNGGHSAENANETVASLLNTVYSGKFGEVFSAMDGRVASLYEHMLKAVRDALVKGGCPESSPVIAAIDSTLVWGKGDSEAPIEDFVIPHMEDLLMPNLEEFEAKAAAGTLEFADLPVFILDPTLFKKLVLKSPGLSFVYVYNQDEQDNVELVRASGMMAAMMDGSTYATPLEFALLNWDSFNYQLKGGMIYAFQDGQLVPEMSVPVSNFEPLRGILNAPPEAPSEEGGEWDFLFELDELESGESAETPLPEDEIYIPDPESKGNIEDLSPAPPEL